MSSLNFVHTFTSSVKLNAPPPRSPSKHTHFSNNLFATYRNSASPHTIAAKTIAYVSL